MTRKDIDRPFENVFIALAIVAVCIFMMVTGCAPSEGAPDVALQKNTISWPLTGGLDTKKSPLVVQPGSFLRLDNVVQERQGEWRRRNGWKQVAADSMPEVAPYFVGQLGNGSVFINGQAGMSVYSPSLSSSRWSPQTIVQPPQDVKRTPGASSSSIRLAFATNGTMSAIWTQGASADVITVIDMATGVAVKTYSVGSAGNNCIRGAGTSSKLSFFLASGGNLTTYVIDAATGALSGPTTISTGLWNNVAALVDAKWYGGSTITVVATSSSTGNTLFMEWNPATASLATNVSLAVNSLAALALLSDPDASGVRFIGLSNTTPSTRVLRVTSAGAITTNDQVEATQSYQITGVADNAGADFYVVYARSTGALRLNSKASGVVGTAVNFQLAAVWPDASASIDSEGWREPGKYGWSFLLGLHSLNASDPQDTWIEMLMPTGGINGIGQPIATMEPLAAGGQPSVVTNNLYQVVRTAPNHFMMGLPVQVIYEDNAGTIVRHYSADIFEKTYLTSADDASDKMGRPVPYRSTAFVPGGQLTFYDGGTLTPLGTRYPPRAPTVTPSTAGGALTPASQYEYVAVVEQVDGDGNVWRSPPSEPVLVTMGATDNTNTVVFSSWELETLRQYRLALFRSAADGSSPRRWYSQLFTAGANVTVVDTFADAVVDKGEVLYTEGETPTAITPPAYLAWLADDRLFTVNPEYPTEVSYTKNLRPGRLPEFTEVGVVDVDDEFGGVTGGGMLDDKIVVFKRNAVYFLQGSGFTDSGSGDNYTSTLITSDVGAIAGSPIVSAGDKLYFVSERGLMKLDKQGNVTWVGEPVDQYLHQPLVQTPETVFDGCFVPSANEVRFLTTNYILVHNLTFDYWVRWTLSGFRRCLVVNGAMVMFRNDGTVWREGDQTQLTDQGTDFTGIIRSPWMRPSPGISGAAPTNTSTTGQQGMRLYEGRVIYTRTAGGGPVNLTGRLYANNDDAQVQEFAGASIDGLTLSGAASMKPLAKIQKCTAFSAELVLPSGDVTVRVDGFAAVIGVRNGAQATEPGSRYK